MKVTFEVYIRTQGAQPRRHSEQGIMKREGSTPKVLRKIWIRRGELPQGTKSLHMGGIVLP
jgi:hypothetical protein